MKHYQSHKTLLWILIMYRVQHFILFPWVFGETKHGSLSLPSIKSTEFFAEDVPL